MEKQTKWNIERAEYDSELFYQLQQDNYEPFAVIMQPIRGTQHYPTQGIMVYFKKEITND